MSMREEIYPVSTGKSDNPFEIVIAGISYCDGSYHIIRKSSPVLCIEYILQGEGALIYDGMEYHPKKGDIYLLEIGKNHEYYSDEKNPWRKIWINATGSLAQRLPQIYSLSSKVIYEGGDLKRLFGKMVGICRHSKNAVEINNKCALLLHEIFEELYFQGMTKAHVTSDEAVLIKQYIDLHSAENIGIDTLSHLIYKSRSQTIRIFKSAYCITPYEYLLKVRFEKAKNMLNGTTLLIKEIAFRTGFSDEHYFSNLFKSRFGMTPTDFRVRQ